LGLIDDVSSSYRFSAPFIVRLTGLGLATVGVLVLLLAAVVALASLPGAVLTTGLLVAALVWLALLVAVMSVRRRDVVRLDDAGYRVRFVRGVGVGEARWKDVEDVTAPTVEGARCVVLRLRDGRTTTIPVDLLTGSADGFVRDLRDHLNRGHGYRPVPRPGA
jgi:hypothetical protein